MELRSSFEKVIVASLVSAASLFLLGCGITGHPMRVASSRVSFGQRCPSCMLTKTTGCRCSPDGWSYGQTAWRPLMPQCAEWHETTDTTIEPTDMGPLDGEPEPAPTEVISTARKSTFIGPKGESLLPKWGLSWLQPKPAAPLATPSEMAFPAPERLNRIGSAGI